MGKNMSDLNEKIMIIRELEKEVLVHYEKSEFSSIQEYDLKQAISKYYIFLKEIIKEVE